ACHSPHRIPRRTALPPHSRGWLGFLTRRARLEVWMAPSPAPLHRARSPSARCSWALSSTTCSSAGSSAGRRGRAPTSASYNFPDNDPFLWWAILVSNWAHFAASTVRLYTRPDAVKNWPVLTLAFPVIAVAVVTAALIVGEPFGRYLFALYLVWSPYHYSRQAYGLSVMYAYRS